MFSRFYLRAVNKRLTQRLAELYIGVDNNCPVLIFLVCFFFRFYIVRAAVPAAASLHDAGIDREYFVFWPFFFLFLQHPIRETIQPNRRARAPYIGEINGRQNKRNAVPKLYTLVKRRYL